MFTREAINLIKFAIALIILATFNNCGQFNSNSFSIKSDEITVIFKTEMDTIEKTTTEVKNINGHLIIDRDIMIGTESQLTSKNELYLNITEDEAKTINNDQVSQSVLATTTPIWPGGVIPYVYDSSLSDLELISLKIFFDRMVYDFNDQMRKQNINISFVERTTEKTFLTVNGSSETDVASTCFATLGRTPFKNVLNLGPLCRVKAVAFHEMLHVLGFGHEQTRHDADEHLEIFPENMIDGLDDPVNFDSIAESLTVEGLGGFDPDSIMLYNSFDGSKNGEPILLLRTPRADGSRTIPRKTNLSQGDLNGLRSVYGPIPENGTTEIIQEENPFVQNNDNTPSGIPYCESNQSDPDGDGYGWENGKSCLVRANNNDENDTNITDNDSQAIIYCKSAKSDPDGDGYGWENGKSCKVKVKQNNENTNGDPQAIIYCLSDESDPDGDGYGWENGKSCTVR